MLWKTTTWNRCTIQMQSLRLSETIELQQEECCLAAALEHLVRPIKLPRRHFRFSLQLFIFPSSSTLSPLQLLQPTTSRSLHNPTFAVCSVDQRSVGVADRALYDNRSQQASQPLVDATQAHILSLSTRCLSPGRYQLQPLYPTPPYTSSQ